MSLEPVAVCKACGGSRSPGARCVQCHRDAQRRYRKKDPERARQLKQESAKRRHAAGYRRDPEKQRVYNAVFMPNYYRSHVPQQMLANARVRAAKAGVPCTITAADIVIPAVCPVLGIDIEVAKSDRGGFQHGSPSLDRIAPELGYVPGNVAVISNRANLLKRDGTLAEIEALAAWLRRQVG